MHPRQPFLTPELEQSWLAALENAGFDEHDALLFPVPCREASNGDSACYWKPGIRLGAGDRIPDELQPFLDLMNDPDCVGVHRIMLATDRSPEGAAALLRHELEHARQIVAHGQRLLDVYALAIDVLRVRAAGLKGGATYYQWIPMEFDANAASAMFVRARYTPERIDELVAVDDFCDRPAFLSLVGPGAIETLPERMLLFLASIRDLCDAYATTTHLTFAEVLDREWDGAGEVWQLLVDHRLSAD